MPVRLGRRGVAAFALGALSVGSVSFASGAAGADPNPAASCRASLLRAALPVVGTIEPIVANDGDAPCTASDEAGVGVISLEPDLPVTARVLYAQTHDSSSQAEAGVAKLDLPLSEIDPSLPDISARVLTSEAGVACGDSGPAATGSSHVVDLVIAGNEIEIPPPDENGSNQLIIDLDPIPLVVALNEQTTGGSGTHHVLTQRALHVTALAGTPLATDVVVAESQVDWNDNACGDNPPPPPPPPSDVVGWMTGGGQLQADETHNLTLPCTTTQKHPKPRLKVETPGGTFNLDTLSSVSCTNDTSQGSSDDASKAGFNTLTGNGTGSCGSSHSVPVRFTFTDEGEANQGVDEAHITITGSPCAFQGEGTVNGNQQAHRGNNPPA